MDIRENRIEPDSSIPMYRQIVNILHEKIVKGELKEGDKLPSEGELMKLENIISSGRMEEQILENYLGMEELTREMVEAFIDCVSVYDDKSIHIQWRFENGIIFKRFPAGCIRSV